MSSVGRWLQRAQSFLRDELWHFEPEQASRLGVVRLLQFSIMVGQGFVRDQLLLRASALTYFTVLAIVPMLAIVSAVMTAMGITENIVGPIIDQFAAVAPEIGARLREVLENADIGGLGTLGAVGLLLTTLLGISNIERALNHIWGVQHERPLSRRVPDYLAVLIVAPLLLGAGLSLATTAQSQWIVQRMLEMPLFEATYDVGLQQVPTAMMAAAFTFLYWFLPNTQVRPVAALLGGVFCAVVVDAALSAYVGLSVGAARAEALYGVFAQLPLLFVWIYVFWAIVLFGAEIAFAYQNLTLYRREVRSREVGAAEREALALHIAVAVARRFREGGAPIDGQALSELLDAPVRVVRDVAAHLTDAELLTRRVTAEGDEALQLGRPAERIHVSEVLDALRGVREGGVGDAPLGGLVEGVLSELQENAVKGAGGRSLAELLDALPPGPDVDPLGDGR